MKQCKGSHYRWSYESDCFAVYDADALFYACKYIGSSLGFVIDKDVFDRQLQRGRIKEQQPKNIAV